jgi:hypothetical protein
MCDTPGLPKHGSQPTIRPPNRYGPGSGQHEDRPYALADLPQSNDELLYDAARCSLPCAFSRQRVTPDNIPFGKIQNDPESFRHIQIRFPSFAYMRFSYPLLGRNIFNIAESPDHVANNPGTLREPILALSGAPDCEVFMSTSGSEKIEA